jgi:hypothetical protein
MRALLVIAVLVLVGCGPEEVPPPGTHLETVLDVPENVGATHLTSQWAERREPLAVVPRNAEEVLIRLSGCRETNLADGMVLAGGEVRTQGMVAVLVTAACAEGGASGVEAWIPVARPASLDLALVPADATDSVVRISYVVAGWRVRVSD